MGSYGANPNAFAFLVMYTFPLVVLYAFTRLRPLPATLATTFGAVMFLPAWMALDFPLLPPIDKEMLVYGSIMVALLWRHGALVSRTGFGRGMEALALAHALGGVFTGMTNMDPVRFGPVTMPGHSPIEVFTPVISDVAMYAIPFFVGRALIRTSRDLRETMLFLTGVGLVYSLLIVWELRMSPQTHAMFYGYFPTSWDKMFRFGGYRPTGFMVSGLAVAIFMATTVLASAGLSRARLPRFTLSRIPFHGLISRFSTPYLFVMLIACKSLASIIWGVLLVPLVRFLSPRVVSHVAAVMATLVILYPALRSASLIPVDDILETASSISEERALSLWFRLHNEELMMERTRERMLFGWGGYQRGWTYDLGTGELETVPDGAWIGLMSSRGVFGFATVYLLYVLPVLRGWLRFGSIPGRQNQAMFAALMLIVSVRAMDQIPNGFYSSYPILLAGGLTGLLEVLPREAELRRRRAARARRAGADASPYTEADGGA